MSAGESDATASRSSIHSSDKKRGTRWIVERQGLVGGSDYPRPIDHDEPLTRPARLGWRIGARLVDGVVVSWLAVFVVVELLGRLLGGDPLGRETATSRLEHMSDARVLAGLVAVIVAYEVVPVALRGATFGKAALGLRVVSIDTWERPDLLRAVVRAAVLYLPLAVPTVGPLLVAAVVAPALVWPTHRGVHDVLAGTAVIAAERP